MFTVRINKGKQGHEVFECATYEVKRSEDGKVITLVHKTGDVTGTRQLVAGEDLFFMNDKGYTVDIVRAKG
jgi:hypothetical protein